MNEVESAEISADEITSVVAEPPRQGAYFRAFRAMRSQRFAMLWNPPRMLPFGSVRQLFQGGGLRAKAIRGATWIAIGYGAGQVLRLLSNLLLTRLLFPEAFGLMAVVGVFMQGLQMFSDIGVRPAIIQNQRGDDPDFLNTAWTIQVIRGILLTLASAALAIPVARFYEQPMLAALLPVVGLSALASGFNSTKVYTADRHLAIGRLTFLMLVTQIITVACTTLIAWYTHSIWSLVVGGLISHVLGVALCHVFLPGSANRFRWDKTATAELFRFGRWIFLSTVITFVGQQFDRLFLASKIPIAELGVYSIALMMSGVVVACNMHLIRRVGFPSFSKIHRDARDEIPKRYDQVRSVSDWVFLPALGCLLVIAPDLMNLLYDARYAGAGPMLQVLTLGAFLQCILEPAESCLVAIGQPRWATGRYALRTTVCVIGMPIAWHVWGVYGVLGVLAASEVPALLLLWFGLSCNGVLSLRREAIALLQFSAAILLFAGIKALLT